MIKKSILKKLRKPGRYLGNEINVINKARSRSRCNVCLSFPDLYEIGMSHPGLQILYDVVNRMEDARCERVFTPARDYEALLRHKNIPLTSLESNLPLYKFDMIGFSLQHELCYTNILTILDCGRIPLYTYERSARPLVIAGGPCTANPEPVAEIFDAFIVGDGEGLLPQLISRYWYYCKNKGLNPQTKSLFLRDVSQLKGVYVPCFYTIHYANKSTISTFEVTEPTAPTRIEKATIENYSDAPYPHKPIIPYIETVHDRACVEVMRGCPHSCKFCQARHYYHPLRVRSVEDILRGAKEIITNTGYEDLSLLSLSSTDYPDLARLLDQLSSMSRENNISLSLPSIRAEKFVHNVPFFMANIKKSGLTFAPEAGSERLRAYIGKPLRMQSLQDAVSAAYKNGYRHVKLYFMIGLPSETDADLDAMVKLIYDLARLRLQYAKQPGSIHANIGTFIPKPHTFFERKSMEPSVTIQAKQTYLKSKLRKSYIKYNFDDYPTSAVEAALARGGRPLIKVILRAWQSGARLDAWHEHFAFNLWEYAFQTENISIYEYITREISPDEVLPWAHIKLH